MATATQNPNPTQSLIHDTSLDYFGRKLATALSNSHITISDVDPSTNTPTLLTTLSGHTSSVWSVSWAHPKYGTILASCSYDGKVIIWRESNNSWTRLVDFALHTASVNAVAWAPHEVGAVLACASSDGSVSVIEFRESPGSAAQAGTQSAQSGGSAGAQTGAWSHTVFPAHANGVNGISWAPAYAAGSLERAGNAGAGSLVRRFVTGGSDAGVAIWDYTPQGYTQLVRLTGHTDWVRDVAWSPNVLSRSYIASAGQDKTVRIWSLAAGQDASIAANWKCTVLEFEVTIWRVSWSPSGSMLAVSGGDNKVSLWKEKSRDGGWECTKTVED